jgi:hypothetical protein
MNKKPVRILLHILGCIGFLLVPILFSPDSFSGELFSIPPFQRDFVTYLLLVIFFYVNFFILVPDLYLNKKYFSFFLLTLGCFAVIQFLPNILFPGHHGLHPPPMEPGNPPGSHRPPHGPPMIALANRFFQFLAVMIFSMLLRISDRWKQVEKEKLSAELSYLKAQINPHFLFNTLNSIYSLAIQRSDETATAVVKLSDMMRYVTTEAHSDRVSLEKELAYISNYVELQKIRLGKTIRVDYSIEGSTRNKMIAPLLLIPFVENAFKYGVNPEEECYIVISIRMTESELKLYVMNKKVSIDYSKESQSGHGIQSAKQRLEFGYPGKHELLISDKSPEYSVTLRITLE